MTFTIRNSFVHLILLHYSRYGFNVVSSRLHEMQRPNVFDDDHRRDFNSIFRKIQGPMKFKPTLLNEASKLLGLPYPYPLVVTLKPSEQFLFEFIINLSHDEYERHLRRCGEERALRRMCALPDQGFFHELVEMYGCARAVDYIRERFIKFERIGNVESWFLH